MPNTLAHMGLQGVVSRGIIRWSDLKWVYVGCIIPDFPWIWRRVLISFYPAFDQSDYSSIVPIQSSLFFSLFLCSVLALLVRDGRRGFALLALNVLLHLLLDSLQTKWGNGAHFFVPFDWRLVNFGLFWPESLPTYLMTALGLVVFIVGWRKAMSAPARFRLSSPARVLSALFLLASYFILPALFIDAYVASDSHYVKTMSERDLRPGRYVEFDRVSFIARPGGGVIDLADEELQAEGSLPEHSGQLSIRGRFSTENILQVREYHVHNRRFRDNASYAGFLLSCLAWGYYLVWGRKRSAGDVT